jgi:modulator of FtsH protease
MLDAWQPFLVAQIGASAALLGLLFIGVSLNLARIIAAPLLTSRALFALLLLLAVLVAASLLLIPGQPMALLGVEMLLLGVLLAWKGGATGIAMRRGAVTAPLTIRLNLALTGLAVAPYPVAGVLLLAGDGRAFFWIAAGMIVSTIKAVTDAWVLLVEINR